MTQERGQQLESRDAQLTTLASKVEAQQQVQQQRQQELEAQQQCCVDELHVLMGERQRGQDLQQGLQRQEQELQQRLGEVQAAGRRLEQRQEEVRER